MRILMHACKAHTPFRMHAQVPQALLAVKIGQRSSVLTVDDPVDDKEELDLPVVDDEKG